MSWVGADTKAAGWGSVKTRVTLHTWPVHFSTIQGIHMSKILSTLIVAAFALTGAAAQAASHAAAAPAKASAPAAAASKAKAKAEKAEAKPAAKKEEAKK